MNAEYDTQLTESQKLAFNSQFEAFGGQKNTFFDVITAVNLAYDENTKNGWNANNGVSVRINEGSNTKYCIWANSEGLAKGKILKGTGTNISDTEDLYGTTLTNLYARTDVTKAETMQPDGTGQNNPNGYKYYFDCSIGYNNISGKVNELVFTIKTYY